MLHAMPLVWCAVLIILFAAHLAAGSHSAAAAAATIAALAASIAGIKPWIQVALLGLIWLLLRLSAMILIKRENDQPDDTMSG